MADTVAKWSFDCETGIGTAVSLTSDELAQRQVDEDGFAAAERERDAAVAAANQSTILRERNRWLFETDPYTLASGAISDLPDDVLATVQKNLPAIQTWRQQLRDYPDTIADWTKPPPLPEPPNVTLPTGKPLFRLT